MLIKFLTATGILLALGASPAFAVDPGQLYGRRHLQIIGWTSFGSRVYVDRQGSFSWEPTFFYPVENEKEAHEIIANYQEGAGAKAPSRNKRKGRNPCELLLWH